MFSSFFSWLSKLFGHKSTTTANPPPKPHPSEPSPPQPTPPREPENPILVDFYTDSNKVTLYDDIEFRVETSPRGYYQNIEVKLDGAQNIKVIRPFDKDTGTIIIRFNKRSRNANETQTLVALDRSNEVASRKLSVTVSLMQLFWKNHPGRANVCDGNRFRNQCAIRMGTALELSDITLSKNRKVLRRCTSEYGNTYKDHKHGKVHGHVLAAQELANWVNTQTKIFGKRKIFNSKQEVMGRTGVIFFHDGWGTVDHIDVWNGESLVGGFPSYFDSDFKELWFWDVY